MEPKKATEAPVDVGSFMCQGGFLFHVFRDRECRHFVYEHQRTGGKEYVYKLNDHVHNLGKLECKCGTFVVNSEALLHLIFNSLSSHLKTTKALRLGGHL